MPAPLAGQRRLTMQKPEGQAAFNGAVIPQDSDGNPLSNAAWRYRRSGDRQLRRMTQVR